MNKLKLESKIYLPINELREWIKLYWIIEGKGKGLYKKKKNILPDGCTTLLFILKGTIQLSAYENKILTEGMYIVPPVLKCHEDILSDDIFLLDVHLNPGVFYKLFNLPVKELTLNKIYNLDELPIKLDKNILNDLINFRDNKFLLFNKLNLFLISLFNLSAEDNDALLFNLCELYRNGDLEHFYCNQTLSERQIQRKIKNITGLTPKMISRIARFYQVLENNNRINNRININECYNLHKIYDQSHLIKEFKYFTGKSPLKFFDNGDMYLQFKAINNDKIKL